MSDLSLVIRSSSPQNLLHNWRGASLQTFTWEIPRDDSSTRCHYFPSSSGKASFGRFLWKEKRIKREQVNFDWTTWIRIKNHRMNLASCMMHSQDEPRQRWKTLKLVLNCHNLNWVESAAQRPSMGMQFSCQQDTFTITPFDTTKPRKWQSYQEWEPFLANFRGHLIT